MKAGEKIGLFDEAGGKYQAVIQTLSKREVTVRILEKMPAKVSRGSLKLGQAILKRDKMELVIQKAAELGIYSLHPFLSSRTVVKLERGDKRDRWQKIAEEAAKQCGRGSRMKVDLPVSFDDLLKNLNADLKLVFWEEGGEPIRDFFRKRGAASSAPAATILTLIGPEGGFSSEEVEAAKQAGFVCLSLGSRILRAETAAIAVGTLIQYELENF